VQAIGAGCPKAMAATGLVLEGAVGLLDRFDPVRERTSLVSWPGIILADWYELDTEARA
jgi:hypothetical protein